MTSQLDRVGAPTGWETLDVRGAAALPATEVLTRLGSDHRGLAAAEADRRRASYGPNAVRTHHALAAAVLWRQLRSPLLVLLLAAAAASYFVGERNDAVIIGIIVAGSVGLGFVNEYRAEQAAEALHDQVRHRVSVIRDGRPAVLDVVELVPGDVVRVERGMVVPADLRLLDAEGLECDESVLTGESLPVTKSVAPVPLGSPIAQLDSCALMGSVVRTGSGLGVAVCTGSRTEFGRIAVGLGERQPETAFQIGLRRFSMLLVRVAAALSVGILGINLALHRPLIDALLFSLAIAVGITPQLLPAVVTTSLAEGSRHLAARKVLVKRLVCIEDLGDVDVLFTDKTGTLTEGRISYEGVAPVDGADDRRVLALGLVCNEGTWEAGAAMSLDPLDAALWSDEARAHDLASGWQRAATVPFDHERRLVSVLVDPPVGGRLLVTKGAPESVVARCTGVPPEADELVRRAFDAGSRVVAVASRPAPGLHTAGPADETGLRLEGLLTFRDPPKASAAEALGRLGRLGIDVRVVTGDSAGVSRKVCADLGLPVAGVLTGTDLDGMGDAELTKRLPVTTVFARVSPDQKARIVAAQRALGTSVAFMGDGVNDAVALHKADVGISVESGADVAKDAADVVLLEKDLGVLADGVVEGRRTFANTLKYVMMGTSSNFGNMFSAAGASAFLSFLPMLPSQILLNNLLYDASQLAIPTDRVDESQLARPSRWDIGLIRRFMLLFGPISSLFDFATFGVMLAVFHAGPTLFRSGWFVESLATQTLVVFVIRTSRVPFFRSRPSRPLAIAGCGAALIGAALPYTPIAARIDMQPLPAPFFSALVVMIGCYLTLAEVLKRSFFRRLAQVPYPARVPTRERRVHRRAARFSHPGPLRPGRRTLVGRLVARLR